MTTKLNRISAQLQVRDLERAIAFYVEQLGFTLEFLYEDFYAGIEKDGHSIHLKTGSYSDEERTGRRKNEDLDLVFSVNNISAVFEEIAAKEVEIIQPLRQMPYGSEFYIVDPEGYVISFIE